ncbi:hypothetical protein [Actinoplanes sp. NPDC051494]
MVDDEPAELVTTGLRYEGRQTCSAADGVTALDLAARFRPDAGG